MAYSDCSDNCAFPSLILKRSRLYKAVGIVVMLPLALASLVFVIAFLAQIGFADYRILLYLVTGGRESWKPDVIVETLVGGVISLIGLAGFGSALFATLSYLFSWNNTLAFDENGISASERRFPHRNVQSRQIPWESIANVRTRGGGERRIPILVHITDARRLTGIQHYDKLPIAMKIIEHYLPNHKIVDILDVSASSGSEKC